MPYLALIYLLFLLYDYDYDYDYHFFLGGGWVVGGVLVFEDHVRNQN